MRASFFEFYVATSGIFTARHNLAVIGHNTANAGVDGYSRQYAETRATRPLTYYDGRGMVGTGSEVYGIQQIRDTYLDKRYWATTPTTGEYGSKRTQHTLVETVFQELNSGFTERMDKLANLYKNLGTAAGDTNYIRDFVSNAENLGTYFGDTYDQLVLQQRDINEEIKITVDQINSLGDQLASINEMISIYEMDGSSANDLRDERVRLVDELSKYVNVTVSENELNPDYAAGKYPEPEDRNKSDKEYVVKINGNVYVRGAKVNRLECKLSEYEGHDIKNNAEDSKGMFDIYWSKSGAEFNTYSPTLSGELKGLIDMRDGNGGSNPEFGLTDIVSYVQPAGRLQAVIGATISSPNIMFTVDPDSAAYNLNADEKVDLDGLGRDGSLELSVTTTTGTETLKVTYKVTGKTEQPDGTIDYTYELDAESAAALAALSPIAVTPQIPITSNKVELDNLNNGVLTFTLDPGKTKVDIPDSGEITIDRRGFVEKIKYANASRVWHDDGTVTISVEVLNPEDVNPDDLIDSTDPAKASGVKGFSIGETTDYCGIPYYIAKLNEMVRTVARAINVGEYMNGDKMGKISDEDGIGGHYGAYNSQGVQTKSFLFTYMDSAGNEVKTLGAGYSIYNFTAANFQVNTDIANDDMGLLFGSADGDHGESGNEAIYEYIDALRDDKLFQNGTLNDFIASMMTENAVDSQQAKNFEESYSDISISVDTQRMSVHGVNLDEEMTDMIKYRQQLEACSMLMNTVNDCYDILINQLGLR